MNQVVIKLTSAVVIGGKLCLPGEEVEVSQKLAVDLLHRGRGTLVQADEPLSADGDNDDVVDLTKLTKAQLVEQATAWHIDGADTMTKQQLIDAILAAAQQEA